MSENPIHVFAKWRVRPGQLEAVLTMVKALHAKTIEEPGNLFYTIFQDSLDANTLILYEGYTDETALDQHRNSIHYNEFVVEKIRPLLQEREVILTTPVKV